MDIPLVGQCVSVCLCFPGLCQCPPNIRELEGMIIFLSVVSQSSHLDGWRDRSSVGTDFFFFFFRYCFRRWSKLRKSTSAWRSSSTTCCLLWTEDLCFSWWKTTATRWSNTSRRLNYCKFVLCYECSHKYLLLWRKRLFFEYVSS